MPKVIDRYDLEIYRWRTIQGGREKLPEIIGNRPRIKLTLTPSQYSDFEGWRDQQKFAIEVIDLRWEDSSHKYVILEVSGDNDPLFWTKLRWGGRI